MIQKKRWKGKKKKKIIICIQKRIEPLLIVLSAILRGFLVGVFVSQLVGKSFGTWHTINIWAVRMTRARFCWGRLYNNVWLCVCAHFSPRRWSSVVYRNLRPRGYVQKGGVSGRVVRYVKVKCYLRIMCFCIVVDLRDNSFDLPNGKSESINMRLMWWSIMKNYNFFSILYFQFRNISSLSNQYRLSVMLSCKILEMKQIFGKLIEIKAICCTLF